MASSGILNLYYESPSCWAMIIQYLDLSSLQILRLTNKALGGKCVEPHFKQYLETKTTDLSENSLNDLAALAAHPFGIAVRNLKFIATVYSTSQIEEILETGECPDTQTGGVIEETSWSECTEEELAEARFDLDWLKAKKKEQMAATKERIITSLSNTLKLFESLHSLELDAKVHVSPRTEVSTMKGEWKEIRQRASFVYQVVMTALAKSGIGLETLCVYGNTPRCSVPIRGLAECTGSLQSEDFSAVGASIKSLSLSICGETIEPDTDEHSESGTENGQNSQAADNGDIELSLLGVAELLLQLPNLETLDLHFYHTGKNDRKISQAIFSPVASRVRLQFLQRCAVRGIYTDKSSMLHFLAAHPTIRDLELAEVHIESDWDSVIAQLNAILPSLEKLQLSNLWDKALMHLEPNWHSPAVESHKAQWQYRAKGGWHMHKVVLEGQDVQRASIEFKPPPWGRQLGSPEFRQWRERKRMEYGPP